MTFWPGLALKHWPNHSIDMVVIKYNVLLMSSDFPILQGLKIKHPGIFLKFYFRISIQRSHHPISFIYREFWIVSLTSLWWKPAGRYWDLGDCEGLHQQNYNDPMSYYIHYPFSAPNSLLLFMISAELGSKIPCRLTTYELWIYISPAN